MAKGTRSNDIQFQLEGNVFRRTDMLDLSRVQQLPTTKYVIERYHTIKQQFPRTKSNKDKLALGVITNELRYVWIHMNIPCLSYPTVRTKIHDVVLKVEFLRNVQETRRKEKWYSDVNSLSSTWKNGFDIRCHTDEAIQEMKTLYDVEVSKDEEDFYCDNCLLVDKDGNKLE